MPRPRRSRRLVSQDPTPSGVARHFEGWELLIPSVFLAALVAVLTLPRAVPPELVPPPHVDPRALAALAAADDEAAASAEVKTLSYDVRELGSTMRVFRRADAKGDSRALDLARNDLSSAANRVVTAPREEIVRLRAYQLRAFLRELKRWEATGVQSDELLELAGTALDAFRGYGWLREDGPSRDVLIGEFALRAAYKTHWNEVAGITRDDLGLESLERRALLAFMIEHPASLPIPPEMRRIAPRVELARTDERSFRAQWRLQRVEEFALLDPTYPIDLARGTLYFQLGRYAESADAFRRFLEANEQGPFHLRAQNHLRAALEANAANR